MKTSKMTRTAVLAALPAPAAANAQASRGPSAVAGEIAREVLSATLGEGVSQAFAAAMGIGQSTPNAVSLSQEAFDVIGGLIGNALDDNNFIQAKAAASTALQNAEDYRRALPGNGMSAGTALSLNLSKIDTITTGATGAANTLVSVGLRGLPLYQMVQAASLAARDEQIAINPVNADSTQSIKNTVVSRVFAHIDAQLDHWESQDRDVVSMPIYRQHSREDDCNIFGNDCQDHWWKYCINAPSGQICSADYRNDRAGGNSNGTVGDNQPAFNYAFRVRSRELAASKKKAFGDVGKVLRQFATHAELADGFGTPHLTAYPHSTTTGWSNNEIYLRLSGDVDGDGNDDVV